MVQFDTLLLLLLFHIVEVHELLLHVRCSVAVGHLVEFKLRSCLQSARSFANLALIVILLIIVRHQLVPKESGNSLAFPQIHADCWLSLVSLTRDFKRDVWGLKGVNLGSWLGTVRVDAHFSCQGRLLSFLSKFKGFLALVSFHNLVKSTLLAVKSPAYLTVDLWERQGSLILRGLCKILLDHVRRDKINPRQCINSRSALTSGVNQLSLLIVLKQLRSARNLGRLAHFKDAFSVRLAIACLSFSWLLVKFLFLWVRGISTRFVLGSDRDLYLSLQIVFVQVSVVRLCNWGLSTVNICSRCFLLDWVKISPMALLNYRCWPAAECMLLEFSVICASHLGDGGLFSLQIVVCSHSTKVLKVILHSNWEIRCLFPFQRLNMLLLLLNYSLLGQLRLIKPFASDSHIHRGIIEHIVLIPHNFVTSYLHASLSQVPLLLIQVPDRLCRRI